VSSDRDEASFSSYYAEQPWLALDYSCRKAKEQLSNLFGVRGIPSFVLVDKDGSTITTEGRSAVSKDPTGTNFPWHPKPVADLQDGPGNLNDGAVVVAFCEAAEASVQQAAERSMEPIAKSFVDDAKKKGEACPEISFMIAKGTAGISTQLRSMLSLEALPPSPREHEMPPKLMLINIPDDGAYYAGPEGDITPDALKKFVQDFKDGLLERMQLEG